MDGKDVNLGDDTATQVHYFQTTIQMVLDLNLNLTLGQMPVDGLSLTTMHNSFV